MNKSPQTYAELFDAVRSCFGATHTFNIEVTTWYHGEIGRVSDRTETRWTIWDGTDHHTGATPALVFQAFLASDPGMFAESVEDAAARVDTENLPPPCGHEGCK